MKRTLIGHHWSLTTLLTQMNLMHLTTKEQMGFTPCRSDCRLSVLGGIWLYKSLDKSLKLLGSFFLSGIIETLQDNNLLRKTKLVVCSGSF